MRTMAFIPLLLLASAYLVFGKDFSHPKLRQFSKETRITDTYILVFDPSISDVESKVDALKSSLPGIEVEHIYYHALKGVSFAIPETTVYALSETLSDEEVLYAEEDHSVYCDQSTAVQYNAPWNLDRVDQRSSSLDGQYDYSGDGSGVSIYILDTGLHVTHNDFSGRASCEFSAIPRESCAQDLNGHGTHVAGTAGGSTYGIAKGANLIGVKVLSNSGSGTYSGIVKGVDYVVSRKMLSPSTPMVINMSLGGQRSDIVNDAVERAWDEGIVVVVAAGNESTDACLKSPAGATNVITVAASEIPFYYESDAFAFFSNHGPCVDIIAPGVNILSAWPTSNTASERLDGTSMASPLVAGVAALYLQQHPSWSPQQVKSAMETDSVAGPQRYGTTDRLVSTIGVLDDPDDDDIRQDDDSTSCGETYGLCLSNADCCSNNCWLYYCYPSYESDEPDECGGFLAYCSRHSDCCSNDCFFGLCYFKW